MFTGIIEEVGTIRSHEGGELVIACDLIRSDAALGDSIAVNGVDLTVRTIDDDALRFDVMTETYRRANLDELKPGDAAPGFTLPGSDGKTHQLSDYAGKVVVVAWFPKAFTGG